MLPICTGIIPFVQNGHLDATLETKISSYTQRVTAFKLRKECRNAGPLMSSAFLVWHYTQVTHYFNDFIYAALFL